MLLFSQDFSCLLQRALSLHAFLLLFQRALATELKKEKRKIGFPCSFLYKKVKDILSTCMECLFLILCVHTASYIEWPAVARFSHSEWVESHPHICVIPSWLLSNSLQPVHSTFSGLLVVLLWALMNSMKGNGFIDRFWCYCFMFALR